MITYFLEGSLVVILIFGLTILDLLIMLLTSTIFLGNRVGNMFLMWTISSTLILEAWAYDFLVVVVVKLLSFDFNEFWGELILGFGIVLGVLAKHSDMQCWINFSLLSVLSLFQPNLYIALIRHYIANWLPLDQESPLLVYYLGDIVWWMSLLLWNALDINIFLFLLSIFLDFIFLFFWISFSF